MSAITKYPGFTNKAGLWCPQFYTSQSFNDVVESQTAAQEHTANESQVREEFKVALPVKPVDHLTVVWASLALRQS